MFSRPLTSFARCFASKPTFSSSLNQQITSRINQFARCNAFHSLKQSNQSLRPAIHRSIIQSSKQTINQSARRTFQSDPNQSTLSNISNTWAQWKPRLVTYFYVGTALFVGVMILRGGLYFVNFFTSLDFADVGRWAFGAGLVTGLSLVGVGMIVRRAMSLRPESVYQDALKQVLNDITVRSFLGNSIKTGSFRAYSFVPGTLRVPGTVAAQPDAADEVTAADPTWMDRITRYWKPRRLQLFFQVTGDDGSHGMVSAEVQKVRGSMSYNLLCVDILNTGQRVVLLGSPDYQIYQGIIKLR